jgi:hypothetical protein
LIKRKRILPATLFLIYILGRAYADQKEPGSKLNQYGIGEPDKVKMSYRLEGAHSPFTYVQVEVGGDGNASCSFQYRNLPEQVIRTQVDKPFIEEIIRLHAELDFFEFIPGEITEPFVIDLGQSTLFYQFKERSRAVSYASIKVKPKGRILIPATPKAELLFALQKMYWKVTDYAIYSYNLERYKDITFGELASLLTNIEADVKKDMVLKPERFLPTIMEIISQEDYRQSIGQYAAGLLEAITGQSPPGDWWDCQRWLSWWQENKAKYEKD